MEENLKRIFNIVLGSGIIFVNLIFLYLISYYNYLNISEVFVAWILTGIIYFVYTNYTLNFIKRIFFLGYEDLFTFLDKNFGPYGFFLVTIPLFLAIIFSFINISLTLSILSLNLIPNNEVFYIIKYDFNLFSIIILLTTTFMIVIPKLFVKKLETQEEKIYKKLFRTKLIIILFLIALFSLNFSYFPSIKINNFLNLFYYVTITLWAYKGFEYLILYINKKENIEYYKKTIKRTIGILILLYSFLFLGFLNQYLKFKPDILLFIKETFPNYVNIIVTIILIYFVLLTFFGTIRSMHNFIKYFFKLDEWSSKKLISLVSIIAILLFLALVYNVVYKTFDIFDLFIKSIQASSLSILLFYLGLSTIDISYLKSIESKDFLYPVLILLISVFLILFIKVEVLSLILGMYLLALFATLIIKK